MAESCRLGQPELDYQKWPRPERLGLESAYLSERAGHIENFLSRAGAVATDFFGRARSLNTKTKLHGGDLQTEADLAVEEMAREYLEKHFPGEALLGEENSLSHRFLEEESWSGWVIDPIDGTNNFARGIPYWGISLAWVEDGQPKDGGIYTSVGEILLTEIYPGAGVSDRRSIDSGARVATSNSLDYERSLQSLARYQKLPGAWIDCLGSSSAVFVDLASGRLDLYHHNGLRPWDNPAGFLLVREAGGVVWDLDGEDADWRTSEIVAGPRALAEEFLSLTLEV